MSATKRWAEEEQAAIRADKKSTCGCYFNFDDKFEVLCDEHQAEADDAEMQAEYEWDIHCRAMEDEETNSDEAECRREYHWAIYVQSLN